VNAAFLLVTSAWLAGEVPAAPPALAAKPAPATVAPAAGCGTCCNDANNCDSCCDSCGRSGLFSRLKGLCKKGNDCCDTCNTCAQPTCAATTCCASNSCCDDGCGRKGLLSRLGGLCRKNKGDDCCNSCGTTCGSSCCDDGCGKRGLFSGGRLRGLFSKNKGCCDSGCDSGCDSCGSGYGTGCATGGCGAAPATQPEPIPAPKGEAPKKMPTTSATPMKQVQIITPATETVNNPFELHRRYEARVAHAPDYSCVTGQLFYVHADGGLWILRYAPLWQEDTYGGSIILARDLRMDSYREGDLVTVQGEILSKKGSVFLGGPLFRAASIQLVDRDTK